MFGEVVGFVFGEFWDVGEEGLVLDVVRLILPMMFGFGWGFMFMWVIFNLKMNLEVFNIFINIIL